MRLLSFNIGLLIVSFYSASVLANNCLVDAYVSDTDPAGLNIRATPKGKIIGKIPTQDGSGVRLKIIDSNKGWMKIKAIEVIDSDQSYQHPSTGWVHGSMITVGVKLGIYETNIALYQSPLESSSKGIELYHVEGNKSIPTIKRLMQCRGKWLQVKTLTTKDNQATIGWLAPTNQCSNPLTTCP